MGDIIEFRRKEENIDLADLALECGCGSNTFHLLMNGEVECSECNYLIIGATFQHHEYPRV